MKLNKFLLSAIAAASLTACSDSTDVVKNDKGQWNADGTGYVSLSISMPENVGSKGSRETINDKFEKGDDNEYEVKNATLVIFSGNDGDSEGNYTLDAAYKLPLKFQTTGTNGNQIISKATITQQINKPSKAKAKALVILNLPSGLSLDDSKHELNKISTTGGTESSTTLKGTTFTDFQAIELTLNTDVANGFTMTNAPLTNAYSTAAGLMPEETAETKRTTTTLADIKEGSIKNTPEDAAANKAADIYVERSVAKVTVKKGEHLKNKISTNTEINCEVKQFALDNTNKTSFLVRNVDNSWAGLVSKSTTVNSLQDKYRFVGFTEVETGKGYRTYWAKDPNYEKKLENALPTSAFSDLGEDKPLYCMENTFDVAHQTNANTTRAIVKVQLWKNDADKDQTYYMYNNDASTFDLQGTDLGTNTNLLAAANKIALVVAKNKTVTALGFENAKDKNGNILKGYKQINDVTIDGAKVTTGEIFESIKNYFGNIAVYENGYAYYPVLIKHFGDGLTPWNKDEYGDATNAPVSSTEINKIYPEGSDNRSDANYLGRYGVVRNNWYELTVNNVKKLGKPGINTPDNTPDDELDSYISVSINILSWAKRSQDVDLQ